MEIRIDNKLYTTFNGEFSKKHIDKYCNLNIYPEIGNQERIIGLLNDVSADLNIQTLITCNATHGGFIPLSCNETFKNVFIIADTLYSHHLPNIDTNIGKLKKRNVEILDTFYTPTTNSTSTQIIFIQNQLKTMKIDNYSTLKNNTIIVSEENQTLNDDYSYKFKLKDTLYTVYVPDRLYDSFYSNFRYYLENGVLQYDNLIHLCIMVKNGGEQFEAMLKDNLHLIDRWTILDTGSTDNTVKYIEDILVNKKKGTLYQEPFINFRDSRNVLLDYADKTCKYTLMLDDTYVVRGDLRQFLTTIRGDQYGDSYSLFVHSDDVKYSSNRIIKTHKQLRYIHTIHEVITDKDNINIIVPDDDVNILDRRFEYMEQRTTDRKQLDLQLLYKELEENPNNPRTYYYLAQTYSCIDDHENAYKYFLKRATFRDSGFRQELVDAIFEAGRIANFKLNLPWSECLKLYEDAYETDKTRPDAIYFIGMHYYLENQTRTAFKYLKKAFEIGFPSHTQYSLKPTLSFHFVPKFLARLCYTCEEYALGIEACKLFLKNNDEKAEDYQEIASWHSIYKLLNEYKGDNTPNVPSKPILCFVAPGGFNKWSGKTIYTSGVGGSETYIIELARNIQQHGHFDVYVFCNCEENEIFEGVTYQHLSGYTKFINTHYVHTVIVSRYSEYLPVTYKGWSENVYLVCHDLTPSGIVIPVDNKLKNIFTLTEWHTKYLQGIFPNIQDKITHFYYGIDLKNFNDIDINKKEKNSFIYSSFANRGLLPLLQMWPKIYEKYSDASLHIYCDLDNKWVNDFHSEQIRQIKELFEKYGVKKNGMNIYYYGWVNKKTLADAWKRADYWFYPCIFLETFCLTALEASITKTLAITNGIGALENTVGNRGITISGDPMNPVWQEDAITRVLTIMSDESNTIRSNYVNENYRWSSNMSWKDQANKLLTDYILPNSLEYKNMFNWTNDCPHQSKEIFIKVIEYFNNMHRNKDTKVLEIGVWTGISLLNIVKMIPKSTGVGVDMWKSYNENDKIMRVEELEVEQSFYKNIALNELQDRIAGIKGDSTTFLLNTIRKNDMYDFIYVDGSHTMLDAYSDMILAWNILNKNGIMAIDDYYFNYDGELNDAKLMQNRLYESVNNFMEKYKGQYTILHIGYRVFLEKL
jgi:glycosyltransferase involved in cell wall biosynthesis/predicted O-methyltransferase YrrM